MEDTYSNTDSWNDGDMSSRTFVSGREQCQESEENDETLFDSVIEPSSQPISYLPSWVLKMREKIATSRTAHADAEQRISQLNTDVNTLSAKLLVMRPLVLVSRGTKGSPEKAVNPEKRVPKTYMYQLPTEMLTLVIEYLQIRQILRLDLVSRTLGGMVARSTLWSEMFSLYCPHLQHHIAPTSYLSSDQRNAQMKLCMVKYLKHVKVCTDFIQTMKDQRSVPKHRSVQPHRHTRQERQVTHPMPVFEQPRSAQGSAQGGVIQGSSWGQRADALRSADRIMSHAETLSSDFRSVAHKALSTLSEMTSDCQDPVIYKLVSDGAITVLAALLLNEEGAIQNYACVIIANLLCWEARKRTLFRHQQRKNSTANSDKPSFSLTALSPQTLTTLEALFGMSARTVSQIVPLTAQVQACGGFKMMTSLLTSPTASINLASSSTSVYRGKGDGSGDSVGGSSATEGVKKSTTSNIQGMCNKQASRALLALLYPEMSIPAPVTLLQSNFGDRMSALKEEPSQHSEAKHSSSGTGCEGAKSECKSDFKETSPVHIWRADAKYSELTATPSTLPTAALSPNRTKLAPLAHAPTSPLHSPVSLATVSVLQPSTSPPTSTNAVPEQLRAPMVSPLFTSDTAARPWLFSYFYKSGAVKDQFTCYLRFIPIHSRVSTNATNALTGAELRGRGIDSIGAFVLTGRAEADISGWTWYFHKSYVSTTFGTNASGAADQENGGSALQWVQTVEQDVFSASNGSNGSSTRGATVHVSHVAYWSAGVEIPAQSVSAAKHDCKGEVDAELVGTAPAAPAATEPPSEEELDFIDEEPSGVWGVGLWGVWETSSGTTPHFELQKGGVFRAGPIII